MARGSHPWWPWRGGWLGVMGGRRPHGRKACWGSGVARVAAAFVREPGRRPSCPGHVAPQCQAWVRRVGQVLGGSGCWWGTGWDDLVSGGDCRDPLRDGVAGSSPNGSAGPCKASKHSGVSQSWDTPRDAAYVPPSATQPHGCCCAPIHPPAPWADQGSRGAVSISAHPPA